MDKSCNKRKAFKDGEVLQIIEAWSESFIQAKFKSCTRHNLIWEKVADNVKGLGINRTPTEIKHKINNLKSEYHRRKPRSGKCHL